METKLLSEDGWKTVSRKFNVKEDKGLLGALAAYEKLGSEQYEERCKALAYIGKTAGDLRKAKDVASSPEAVKYLSSMASAADSTGKKIALAQANMSQIKATALEVQALSKEGSKSQVEGGGCHTLELKLAAYDAAMALAAGAVISSPTMATAGVLIVAIDRYIDSIVNLTACYQQNPEAFKKRIDQLNKLKSAMIALKNKMLNLINTLKKLMPF